MPRKDFAMIRISILATALLAAGAFSASADSIGQQEFMNSCAQCHGGSGMGDGPLAGFLNTKVPDLTLLQKNNDGVFPIRDVYSVIDGSVSVGAHGSADMPAWGNRYRIRGAGLATPEAAAEEAEVYARFRILALTEYLATIQQD